MQVFERARLDAQLRAAACALLRDSVHVYSSRGATTIALPRVCQWYARDFSASGSPLECAQAVAPYLEGEQRACLDACLKANLAATSGPPPSVLFLPFDFTCRPLSLLADADADAAAAAAAATDVPPPGEITREISLAASPVPRRARRNTGTLTAEVVSVESAD